MTRFPAFRGSAAEQPAVESGPATASRVPVVVADRGSQPTGPAPASRPRRLLTAAATAVAVLLVGFALLSPERYGELRPAAFLRIPAEGLVGTVLALLLPRRARRSTATVAGAALGLVILVKLLDLAFSAVVGRPFDLVLDWTFFGNGLDYVRASAGRAAAVAAVVGAVALACAVPLLTVWSLRRLAEIVVRRRTAAVGSVGVLSTAWVGCLLLGVHVVTGEPVAAGTTVQLVQEAASEARSSLSDRALFRAEEARDRFRATPSGQLLTGLKGKDVLVAFVESYGRSAVENPQLAPGVDRVLTANTARLQAAGFGSASAWLTSPTVGGLSWLAHSTLLSGVKIANPQRYRALVTSNRLTLTSAFDRAGWRTVALLPATHGAWPEGSFYGYQKMYVSTDLGYHGPGFSWAPMTDQFALAALQRKELGVPGHPPVMVEAELISSHAPWAPLPRMVPWKDVGDGSVFDPMPSAGKRPNQVWPDPNRVRAEYGHSIEYSLTALLSFVETYGTKNTVLVFLGDHQPAPIVTGGDPNRDVPIAIVAKDPAVLRSISGWGWQQGLQPGPHAPVWPMEAFRDRFLAAFSPGAR